MPCAQSDKETGLQKRCKNLNKMSFKKDFFLQCCAVHVCRFYFQKHVPGCCIYLPVQLEPVDTANLKMSEYTFLSKLQLGMTKWECTGKKFEVEVALNGGCVTVVFSCPMEAAALLQLSS